MRALVVAVLVLAACTPVAAPSPTPSAAASAVPRASGPVAVPPLPPTGAATTAAPAASARITLKEFPVPAGSVPHDVAPAADGGVWYTAQRTGELGWLDPKTGQTKHVKLGQGSSPHGVIVGPDGAPWITDSGLNAIVRVDPRTNEVTRFAMTMPLGRTGAVPGLNLNTAAFDRDGFLWFTGQSGYYGRLDLRTGRVEVAEATGGRGPYGIAAGPGAGPGIFYASLAGHHIAEVFFVDTQVRSGPPPFSARAIAPPSASAGPRRVWSDSKGVIWVSEWDAGQLGRYDPASRQWKEWKLPGARPQAYAVFVDDRDIVWLSDFGASAIVRFEPATERFDVFPHAPGGNVRQIHGRPGEVWGALSAHDKLLLVTTR